MNRNFEGIWIPKEIWLCRDISVIEKCLLVEINSLDNEKGCFASNAYFADFFQISQTAVSLHIAKLLRNGYLKKAGFDGRKRILKTAFKFSLRQNEREVKDSPEESLKHNNTVNNTSNNIITLEQNTLYNSIKQSFEAKTTITDYPKEMKAIKGICTKVNKHENPTAFAQEMLEVFYDLTQNGSKFWKEQPFLPSALNASGIWDRVNVQLKNKRPSDDLSWVDDYLGVK